VLTLAIYQGLMLSCKSYYLMSAYCSCRRCWVSCCQLVIR